MAKRHLSDSEIEQVYAFVRAQNPRLALLALIESNLEGLGLVLRQAELNEQKFQWPDNSEEKPLVYIPLPEIFAGLVAIVDNVRYGVEMDAAGKIMDEMRLGAGPED